MMTTLWHRLRAWRQVRRQAREQARYQQAMRMVHRQEAQDKSFAWKVRWRKEHDRNPLLSTVQDKLKVKEYARERGVNAPEVLYVTNSPVTIPFDDLPENYFIKATHGCAWNIICMDSKLYRFGNGNAFIKPDGSPADANDLKQFSLTREACVALCEQWLRTRYLADEWAYQNIDPGIIVEEPIKQAGGGILREYKLFTMGGSVKAIAVVGAIFRINHCDRLFFDGDWNLFPSTERGTTIRNKELYQRPDTLKEMVEAAQRLSRGLDFIRVDLYNTTRGVLLGEMTVYPFAGSPGTPSSCPIFNKWLGDQWILPS